MSGQIHILGVRHHGPGSARSVVAALEQLRPEIVLIEGPPDADALIPLAAGAGMTPPVALLVYDVDRPVDSAYFPFAEFSPEWQAMRWALANGAAVRFMDLPQALRPVFHVEQSAATADDVPEAGVGATAPPTPAALPIDLAPPVEFDPLQRLAEAAGFDDGERWWEHVVEHRAGEGVGAFAAVLEAMTELRRDRPVAEGRREACREAYMRRTIREANKANAATIVAVCGAWHGPALDVDAYSKKDDDALIKSLTKHKTAATWVPWTYDRLAAASGYGAGVRSPGWYDHLWHRRGGRVLDAWMARVARLLRDRDIDCSSAHVIEGVRLAQSLATMRGRPLADLADITDATRAVFCFDSDAPMRLIERTLLVGDRLGEVPDTVPMVPLQQDLIATQKRLRLKPEALEKPIDLDLRDANGRDKSVLLHRLRLIGIDWGTPAEVEGAAKGTFKERWLLRWDPAYVVRLIEAGALGNTVADAAGATLTKLAADSFDLPTLAARLNDAMAADLGDAARALVRRLQDVAALATDVTLLLRTLGPLVTLARYGSVRQTDAAVVRDIIGGIVPRVTAGLANAVASLNDDAAANVDAQVTAAHAALQRLEDEGHTAAWLDALGRVAAGESVHGLLRGRATRLLLDAARVPDVADRISRTLSRGTDPGHAARWLEGFLGGSGLMLVHDPKLLAPIDAWLGEIAGDVFEELLPLLRRTFATFPAGERRQIGQSLANGRSPSATGVADGAATLDPERAARPLPLLVRILGGPA